MGKSLENILKISAKTSKLEISKVTKKYDQNEITYVNAIIECLKILQNHLEILKNNQDTSSIEELETNGYFGQTVPHFSVETVPL